jgi:hypothetical protein
VLGLMAWRVWAVVVSSLLITLRNIYRGTKGVIQQFSSRSDFLTVSLAAHLKAVKLIVLGRTHD